MVDSDRLVFLVFQILTDTAMKKLYGLFYKFFLTSNFKITCSTTADSYQRTVNQLSLYKCSHNHSSCFCKITFETLARACFFFDKPFGIMVFQCDFLETYYNLLPLLSFLWSFPIFLEVIFTNISEIMSNFTFFHLFK